MIEANYHAPLMNLLGKFNIHEKHPEDKEASDGIPSGNGIESEHGGTEESRA